MQLTKTDGPVFVARALGLCAVVCQGLFASMWFSIWRSAKLLDRDACRLSMTAPAFIFPYVLAAAFLFSIVGLVYGAWVFHGTRREFLRRVDILLLGISFLGVLSCLAASVIYVDGFCPPNR